MVMKMKAYTQNWACILMLICISACTACAEADYTLEVFGNANMDETIDQGDIALLKAMINGTESPTRLADANNNGKIDESDVDQIEMIIGGTESEIIVNDALNRTVTVKRPVERVIPLRLAIAEAMVAMDADDKVVGVASDTAEQPVLFPELSQLPNVGKASLEKADIEKIISLKPNLVLVNEYENKEQIDKLEAAGVTVISSECHGDLLNSISAARRLGYILGVADKAEEYTNWYGGYLDNISSRVEGLSDEKKPRVFYYWNWGEDTGPLGTSGKDCPVSPLISFVGGRDIAADMPGEYIEVDPEWVMEQNPSLIVRELMYKEAGYDVNNSTVAEEKVEGFMNRSGFSNIDAVKNGDVHVIAVNILSDNSWIGTVYLAKLIQPDLFQDLDPRAVHQEYLTKFLNLDFDIDNQGMFLHPVPEDW
jgi:iron complex transport system substrate-binding protein